MRCLTPNEQFVTDNQVTNQQRGRSLYENVLEASNLPPGPKVDVTSTRTAGRVLKISPRHVFVCLMTSTVG